jgi:Holliday junction resolvase-like predicted endonuclease
MDKLTPRQQGDLGELSAIEWLASKGAVVLKPLFHSPSFDLAGALGDAIFRVEVKTSRRRNGDRWSVAIATRGGNRSWNGVSKHFDSERCDYLFVLVGDGRRWFIPSRSLDCRSGLTVGGPKYAEFEIEPGKPLPSPQLESTAALGERRSWRDGPACKVGALVLSEFDSHLPHLTRPSLSLPRLERSKYERKLGKTGHAVINQKRRLTIPQSALVDSGLRDGDYVAARADGPGRIVIEKVGLPVWAEAP